MGRPTVQRPRTSLAVLCGVIVIAVIWLLAYLVGPADLPAWIRAAAVVTIGLVGATAFIGFMNSIV